ncbi:excinuclease ABC subunit C [Enterococcus faecalis]|nr:excinuclease ABC subunit C [Enterococcus faecalis]NFA64785.1 excinuclease ABC subunit C [Enterococcus faecalis]NFA95324.1 excinuclease ABC subunit C [Enterococcus faecalis]
MMENFMKKFNYQGAVIKDNNKISSVAYVQCACGCLASRVSSDSVKYKCSLCKRVYVLKRELKVEVKH